MSDEENMDKKIVIAAGKSNRKDLEKLLKKGVNPNSTHQQEDYGGKRTPLMNACANGHIENVKMLLEYKADVNQANDNGWTPLMVSMWPNKPEIAELLLKAGARLDDKNKDGWCAAHFAAQKKDAKLLSLLIEHKCGVNKCSAQGVTIFMTAATHDSKMAAEALMKAGARAGDKDNKGWSAVHFAAYSNSQETLKYLVTEAKCDAHAITKIGRTPLMIAAQANKRACAQILIDAGVRVYDQDAHGLTALHVAAQNDAVETAKLLIEKRVSVHAANKSQRTALMLAAYKDAARVTKVLLDNGARVTDKDNKDYTALHFCAENNAVSVAKLLVEKGASVHATTLDGRTPLHIAEKKKKKEMINFLKAQAAKQPMPEKVELPQAENHGFISGMFKRMYAYLASMLMRRSPEEQYRITADAMPEKIGKKEKADVEATSPVIDEKRVYESQRSLEIQGMSRNNSREFTPIDIDPDESKA